MLLIDSNTQEIDITDFINHYKCNYAQLHYLIKLLNQLEYYIISCGTNFKLFVEEEELLTQVPFQMAPVTLSKIEEYKP